MGFGGGGIVLSRGLLRRTTTTIRSSTGSADEYGDLERCFDDSEWDLAPGGDWALHRCMARLGLPLTAAGGMHQLDCNSHVHNKVSVCFLYCVCCCCALSLPCLWPKALPHMILS